METMVPGVIDMAGQIIGKLTVIRRSPRKSTCRNEAMWECLCSCGNIVDIPGSQLRSKRRTCGCSRGVYRGAFPNGGASELYQKYRQNAKTRELVFELTPRQFMQLTVMDCHYCGVEARQEIASSAASAVTYWYNGIDRCDNTVGYIISNCVPCCKTCNVMKSTMHIETFLAHIRAIASRDSKRRKER